METTKKAVNPVFMETFKEEKQCTPEELKENLSGTKFYPVGTHISLESAMSRVRIDVDNVLQEILAKSQLPLFLFDYIVTSVLADIRKADIDTRNASVFNIADDHDEQKEEQNTSGT